MKSINFNKIYQLAIFCFLTLSVASCAKNDLGNNHNGPTVLNFKVTGIEAETTELPNKKNQGSLGISNTSSPEVVEIPVNKEYSIYASLEEDNSTISFENDKSSKLAASEITQLTPGIKYGVLVYNGDNLITSTPIEFTVGQENTQTGIDVIPNTTYTVIAFSHNKNNSIPTVTNAQNLSTAEIKSSEDLMIWKGTKTVSYGPQNLTFNLKHQFSLITTVITTGALYSGTINTAGAANIILSSPSGTVKLADGTKTFETPTNQNPIPVDFSTATFPTQTITSKPTLVIGEGNEASFNIDGLGINAFNQGLQYPNLQLIPGKKYFLRLIIDLPCLDKVGEQSFNFTTNEPDLTNANTEFNRPSLITIPRYTDINDPRVDPLVKRTGMVVENGTTYYIFEPKVAAYPLHTFNLVGANDGFVFDIARMDNSLRVQVNGTYLAEARYKTKTLIRRGTPSAALSSKYNFTVDLIGQLQNITGTTPLITSRPPADQAFMSTVDRSGEVESGWSTWAPTDLEFETQVQNFVANFRFEDGLSVYGGANSLGGENIYVTGIAMSGLFEKRYVSKPILRIIANSNGKISVQGAKVDGGSLYPLKGITRPNLPPNRPAETPGFPDNWLRITKIKRHIVAGEIIEEVTYISDYEVRFNDITWNSSGTNTVVVSMDHAGNTRLTGKAYGIKKKVCP